MNNNLITCKNLTFIYEGSNVAVKDLSFTVSKGDYLCIVGENGAGKSTLIKGLLHLKKPESGTIEYAPSLDPRDIGYLPQQTPVQKDFPASVREVVLSGCLNRLRRRPFFGIREKKIALSNMERLGIADLQDRCYRELSGGQQQRVLLARALCASRKVLLLDEPAAGLDPVVTQELYDLIAGINRELGITIIMVSHDIHSSLKYTRHILQLSHRHRFFGTARDYRQSVAGQIFIRESEGAYGPDVIRKPDEADGTEMIRDEAGNPARGAVTGAARNPDRSDGTEMKRDTVRDQKGDSDND